MLLVVVVVDMAQAQTLFLSLVQMAALAAEVQEIKRLVFALFHKEIMVELLDLAPLKEVEDHPV